MKTHSLSTYDMAQRLVGNDELWGKTAAESSSDIREEMSQRPEAHREMFLKLRTITNCQRRGWRNVELQKSFLELSVVKKISSDLYAFLLYEINCSFHSTSTIRTYIPNKKNMINNEKFQGNVPKKYMRRKFYTALFHEWLRSRGITRYKRTPRTFRFYFSYYIR